MIARFGSSEGCRLAKSCPGSQRVAQDIKKAEAVRAAHIAHFTKATKAGAVHGPTIAGQELPKPLSTVLSLAFRVLLPHVQIKF